MTRHKALKLQLVRTVWRAQEHAAGSPAPAVAAAPWAVAAEERGARAGGPQRQRPAPQLLRRVGALLAPLVLLLLQDASPDCQQVLLRVTAHEQRGIEEEVPARSRGPHLRFAVVTHDVSSSQYAEQCSSNDSMSARTVCLVWL